MMLHRQQLVRAAACLALGSSVFAQSFNLDVGAQFTFPLPSNGYGAAASQTGFWSGVSTGLGGAGSPTALRDLATNALTTVTITASGGFGDFTTPSALWSGDDQLLMGDASDIENAGVPPFGGLITWTIANLSAGNYTIYTYALAPDFPAAYTTTVDVTGASEGPQTCVGAWTGSPHVQGVSFAKHTLTITAGQNIVVLTSNTTTNPNTNFGSVNGFQIVKGVPTTPGTAYCFGDGSGTACPCGPGAVGNGCPNFVQAGGARLAASGLASVAADTLVLSGTLAPPGPGLYFQGSTPIAAGSVFGNGLVCAGGSTPRLEIRIADALGASATTVAIHTLGSNVAGDLRYYQLWYRDGAGFCVGAGFNLSNAVSLTWIP